MKSSFFVIRSIDLLSSEYYLGTVPFQADPGASTLRVELVNASGTENGRFTVDIRNKPFSTPEHVANVLSREIQSNMNNLSKALTSPSKRRLTMPSVKFGYTRRSTDRFWFSLEKTKQEFRLLLGKNDPTSVLTKLGFASEMTVEPGQRVEAENSWTFGDGDEHGGRSIRDQRVRSDTQFDDLRSKFENQFGTKRKDKDQGRALPPETLLLAEYLFSLVFLSMYRQSAPTMEIDIASEVDRGSAKEFNEKLSLVCDFDVGSTGPDGPGSLGKAMGMVKEVRPGRR